MSYSSTCTSFTYIGEDFGSYKNVPVTWKSVEIDCSDDWRVVGNTNPFPTYINIRVSISVTNNSGSTVTWTSTSPKFYLLGGDSRYYDLPHSGDMIDMGAWASDRDITIRAGQTVDLSHTFRIDWDAGLVSSSYGYTEHGYSHFFRIIQDNTARFFLGVPQVNFWAGYKRVGATFNFVYPQNIYDYRAWPHRPDEYEVHEAPAEYGINITPSSYSNFNPTVTDFDGTLYASVIHAKGLSTNANNPDIRIRCEQLGSNPLPITYQRNYSSSTYNKFIFGEGCKELFINYFKKNGITTTTTFTFTIQFRNPFKYNSLPIGSMIILPDNSVYEVTRTGDSSKYYQESWQDFTTIQAPFIISPKSNVSSFYASYSNWDIVVDSANGGKDLGCLYAPYTKPRFTLTYTAGWGVKYITVNPQGSAWQNFPSFVFNIPSSSTETTTGTIIVEQPNYYTYAFFGDGETQKTANSLVTVTPSVGNPVSLMNFNRTIYKYVPLEIKSYDGYRANAAGVRNVNGDYIGILSSFVGNEMKYNQYRIYNPIIKTMKITTLADGVVVFDDTINLESDTAWVSKNDYELGAETSYFVEVTLTDSFTSVNFRFNIGTKVAYLEFGDDARHLAVGKYCEKEGFEIQFPVFFAKQVVVLSTGVEKFKEIASVIPYDDTYNIGCSNVQEVLDWLNRRLS